MRPAKLFMYTTGSWPYLNWVSEGSTPLDVEQFDAVCIQDKRGSFAGWIIDVESNLAYGACLHNPYKLLLENADDIATSWPEVIGRSVEGAMSMPLPNFAAALNGHISQRNSRKWGLFDLESDLQSTRDIIACKNVIDTPMVTSIDNSLELIQKLKESLAHTMLLHNFPASPKTTYPGSELKTPGEKLSCVTDTEVSGVVVDNGTAKDRFIKAPHYQGFFKEYQWIEVQQGKPHMRQPGHFLSALHMQVDKYLDRLGRKDDETQEMRKACFYLGFMIMYAEEGQGNCVRVHEWLDALGKKKE